MNVLITTVCPTIIEKVEEATELLQVLDTMDDGPQFEALAKRVDRIFQDIGAFLHEDIAETVARGPETHTRIGGQADGCPPRVVQTLH